MVNPEMIVCRDCGSMFVFTDGEKDFYARQGWDKPFRCRACRERKKKHREAAAKYEGLYEAMRNSCCMKRDTKGTYLNRSGSTWDRIDDVYLTTELDLPEWLQVEETAKCS